MTPQQIYDSIYKYIGSQETIICQIHSACSPIKEKHYMCTSPKSWAPVLDFDSVKTKTDSEHGIESRKSVDAVIASPSNSVFCFVEMKSWHLVLTHHGNETKIRKKAQKYESDLPEKLAKSIEICKQVTQDNDVFNDCPILYILVTDIPVTNNKENGLSNIYSNLTALAGSSSNLNMLCNQLSKNIMNHIPKVETRYWECREFDAELSKL